MNLVAAGLLVWRLSDGQVVPEEGAETARRVGSLQKAWVAKAWAQAHPDPAAPPPLTTCDSTSRCWLAPGHGTLDLRAATARSCNAYFRNLAAGTPEGVLRETLAAAGFEVPARVTPDAAIGLEESVVIAPGRLLRAYAELLTAPWAARDDVRRAWLDGMRDAGEGGTAAGVPLRGFLAKTGTVHALDGAPLGTSGWALLFDPSGRSGSLALLLRGTGSQAAMALGDLLRKESTGGRPEKRTRAPFSSSGIEQGGRPPTSSSGEVSPSPYFSSKGDETEVRVRLFVSLRATEILARNGGTAPARIDREGGKGDWLGPGSEVAVAPGDRLGPGTWQLSLPRFGLVRIVRGRLSAHARQASHAADAAGVNPLSKQISSPPVSLVLHTTRRDYVEGVIRGELPNASRDRKEELGAAILRFLARGARHGAEDVCDLTHCARFAGLGPDVKWTNPTTALVDTRGAMVLPPEFLDDAAWRRATSAAALIGLSFFTGHCGGAPLSEKAVWGHGSDRTAFCSRHSATDPRLQWGRELPAAALKTIFGESVEGLAAIERGGVRFTEVVLLSSKKILLYDDLHRRLAPILGWDALPSPPDTYERVAGGWRVTGRGSGHRVGLCLAD